MKIKILSVSGTMAGETDLPVQFQEPVRTDLVKKAVLAIQNNNRQPYGAYKLAGMRHHVQISRRRRDYKTSYGYGISRVPRKILSSRGTQFFWAGDFAPGTRGGRKAHPPKAEKVFKWKMNQKERRKALRSALSAVIIKDVVASRGHLLPDNYPFIVTAEIEALTKTKELLAALDKLGFKPELERASCKGIRAGKGKLRGRRKLCKKSLLIVVSDLTKLKHAAANIPGVDCVQIKMLNTEDLAPGGHVGRITLFTTNAIDVLKTNLFTNRSKKTTRTINRTAKTGVKQ
jgi:large subunit ribosomal protein L4e